MPQRQGRIAAVCWWRVKGAGRRVVGLNVRDKDWGDAPEPRSEHWERVYTAKNNRLALGLLRSATVVLFVGMAPILVVLAVYSSPLVAIAGLIGLPVLMGVLNRMHRGLLERSEVDIEDRLVGWPKHDAVEITGYTDEGLPLYSTKIPPWQSRAFLVAGYLMAIGTILIFALAYEAPQ